MKYATIKRKPRRLKAAIWCLLCLGFGYPDLAAQASLEATSGIQLEASGGIQVEVEGNWLNQGSLLPGLSTLRFDGATGQAIRNQGGSFYNVTVDKAAGEVTAMGHFNVDGAFTLSSGDVNLNGNVIILGSNALLAETPGHTVKGSSGYLITTRNLNMPNADNVAGMGLTLTANIDLGYTEVVRGHAEQSGNSAASILRYFDVLPANQAGLSADILFHYDESELNGQAEADLRLFRSDDGGANWTLLGGTLDAGANTLAFNGLLSLSHRFTLSAGCMETTVATQAVCQDISVELDASGTASITAADINNGSTGACGIAGISLDVASFNCSDAGPQTVTLTVTGNDGNASICSATVTVEDNVAPVATCQDITVSLNSLGAVTVMPQQIDGGSSDACGIYNTTIDVRDFDCSSVGAHTATLTVTDVNGNTATCTATVTVEDNIAPTAVCQNVTVQLNSNGEASITPAEVDFGSTDNCGIASLSVSPGTFDCGDIGSNTVTLTVTDVNGNSSSCTATVTVEDNIPPNPVCLTTTVFLDPSGQYTLLDTDVLDFDATTDNCVEFFVSAIDAGAFDCDDAGQTFTVPVTVSDGSGNTAGCSATITVEVGKALPAPWASQDVGNPGPGNTYEFAPCALPPAFTIGAGAVNNSPGGDNIAFIEQQLCGDFEISVQVLSITPNCYAGLMARESGMPGSKMVGVYSNHSSVVRVESRSFTNGPKAINFFQKPAPYWLKLVRQGNWFFAYYSFNGVNYSIVTVQQLSMNSCLEVGLAAFSNITGSMALASFGNVNISSGGLSLVELPGNVVEQGAASRTISVFPNPFSTEATIRFHLPEAGQVTLNVFDLQGRLIRQLHNGQLDSGQHQRQWDGAGEGGGQLPSGMYLVQLRSGGEVVNRKVLLQHD